MMSLSFPFALFHISSNCCCLVSAVILKHNAVITSNLYAPRPDLACLLSGLLPLERGAQRSVPARSVTDEEE